MAQITGTAGNDLIRTAAAGGSNNGLPAASPGGGDVILGAEGADTILPGTGWNIALGGTGNDSIALADAGYAFGEAGDDVLATTGQAMLDGGTGNDTLSATGSLGAVLRGGDGPDRLSGGHGNDQLAGDAGADTILGSRGNDTVDGGEGADVIDYGALGAGVHVLATPFGGFVRMAKIATAGGAVLGIDTLTGMDGFVGTAGHDRLLGSGLDESFAGGAGNDTIGGGDGFDTLRYDNAAGPVSVNLATGRASDGLGGTDLLRFAAPGRSSIEMVVAGAGADTLIGDGGDNWLRGGAGADLLDGGAGFDVADWSGDSTVTGVLANLGAVAVGGVAGGSARDSSGATDTLLSIEGLRGTAAADTLIGSDADNLLGGQRGADSLQGGLGDDTADYGDDADPNGDGFGVIVNLSDAALVLAAFGAEGARTVAGHGARDGWGNTDLLSGVEGARGSLHNDVLVGLERAPAFTFAGVAFHARDASVLRGGLGADTIMGADPDDGVIASYRDDAGGIVARLDLGIAVQDGFGTLDTLVNVFGIEGSFSDDLIVAGDNGAFMQGGGGDDTLAGGLGFDRVSYARAAAGVAVDLSAGTAEDGDGGTDSLAGTIEFVAGSRFADRLAGDADGTWFLGLAGADTFIGGAGEDFVSYYSASIDVARPVHLDAMINLQAGWAWDGDGSGAQGSLDRFTSIEHALGSAGADTLFGSSGANSLHGAEGDDSASGGGGNDMLAGGAGADTLDGAGGFDTTDGGSGDDVHIVNSRFDLVIEAAGGGNDTVFASSSYWLGAAAEVEMLRLSGGLSTNGFGNGFDNILMGNGGNNRLEGGVGLDDLYGLDGADTLVGGNGADTLTGHDGADFFYFEKAAESFRAGVDLITDMETGFDRIAFTNIPGKLFAGVAQAGVGFNGAVSVIFASLGTGANTYAEVMDGLNAALGGSGNVTASGGLLQVWQVDVAGGSAAGTYVFVNDGIAGALASADMLVAVTLSGGPLSAGDFLLA
ncbi:calcium-binding protein [Roseomonas sp. AR75]|uniref:beta strand repeat-containing protein n=1 Tax=Roseomonas sp. AR75 TaxID=2562311 RepID=UPI0010C131B1|nr:calcium-binding protein [Roseomonas sp. AR75]